MQRLAEVSHQTKGPLGEEFLRTLEDMKLGKSRREAFYDLRKRVPSEAVSRNHELTNPS